MMKSIFVFDACLSCHGPEDPSVVNEHQHFHGGENGTGKNLLGMATFPFWSFSSGTIGRHADRKTASEGQPHAT